jgi:2-oxoglutarate/2-oxoacid ferredoxin oxidoreductase subunit alpha
VLAAYDRVVVPEMNLGQLAMVLRATYLVNVESYTKVRGMPLRQSELADDLNAIIDEEAAK